MREDLIERLRAVEWEETDDGDRMPDDPTHKCVFVDMRPEDFRELLREAAADLEAAREDACVSLVADIRRACGDNFLRMRTELVEYIRELAEDAERYRHLFDCPEPFCYRGDVFDSKQEADAAIDQARGKAGQEVGNG